MKSLTPAERLQRTLELCALVRAATWEGARARLGDGADADALRRRFLAQLYGFDAPPALRALLDRL